MKQMGQPVPQMLTAPIPARDGARRLRQQVLNYLRSRGLAPGTRLATEAELVEASRLSRSTVRRALEPLVREGWLDRRAGAGTFVGPRAGLVGGGEGEERPAPSELPQPVRPQVVRVAVLIFSLGDLSHDWYTPSILDGINDAAEATHVSVELLGDRELDVEAISRRLMRSQPEVLACLSNEPRHAFVVRDAQKVGIKCIVTGTPHLGLGVPAIHEDNRQAIKLAVQHLAEKGHRRVGFLLQRTLEPWALDRHEAFIEAMGEVGQEPDESWVHWVRRDEPRNVTPEAVEGVRRYLARRQPSAVIAASFVPMLCLERLHRSGTLSVPRDLSIVSFEQNLAAGDWFGGLHPTFVKFPLREMGQRLAEMARSAVDGGELPRVTVLPASLVEGQTVLPSR